MLDQRVGDDAIASQMRQRLLVKAQAGEVIDRALEAGGDQISPLRRQPADTQLKRAGHLGHALGEVRVGHCQLVLVGQQRQRQALGHVALR